MWRQETFENCSDSFLQNINNYEECRISSNNSVNNGQSETSDLRKLSSSIICSASITRKNLLQEPNTTSRSNYDVNIFDDDDDDDEFFKTIKLDIDKNLLQNSKENYKPNKIEQDVFSLRKRKSIFDQETQNVIKRFKKDANINHINSLQTPTINVRAKQCNFFFDNTIRQPYELLHNDNENIMKQQNSKKCPTYNLSTSTKDVGNILRQKNTTNCPMFNLSNTDKVGNLARQKNTIQCSYNLPTSTNDGHTMRQENTISCPTYNSPTNTYTNNIGSIMKQQNIFTSNGLNAHIRNPDEYMFQMCSKIQNDIILPWNRNKTAMVRTECEQVLFYATTFFTPPKKL